MNTLTRITGSILASSLLVACAPDQEAYDGRRGSITYPHYFDDEQAVKVSVSAVKETHQETERGYETSLKAYVVLAGTGGFGKYVLLANQTYGWENPEQPVTTFSMNRVDGPTSYSETTFDGRTIAAEYQRGENGVKTGFDHTRMPELLKMYRKYGTIYQREIERPREIEPDRRWAGYPLQDVGLGVLARLGKERGTSIHIDDLRDAIGMYATTVNQNVEGQPDLAGDMHTELAATEISNDDDDGDNSNRGNPTGCYIPTRAKVSEATLDGSAYGLTARVLVHEVEVDALKTTQQGGLDASGASGAGISLSKETSADCPGWNWGETKINADVNATAEITCQGTTCCPNGADDHAKTMEVEMKLGNEGFKVNAVDSNADGISGASAVEGDAWLCYDEDTISGNDYLGSGYSIKFVAKVGQVKDIDVAAELAAATPKSN